MIGGLIDLLLPDSLWSWLGIGAAGIVAIGIWFVPLRPTATRAFMSGGTIVLALLATLYGAWQSEAERADGAEIERDAALRSEAQLAKTLSAIRQSAIERTADNTRIDAAEKGLRDDLQRIERALPEGAPRPVPDASSVAITCRRLLRTGQTQSPEYRASCR